MRMVLRYARAITLKMRLARACRKFGWVCLKTVYWIPVFFVVGVLAWGYVVYVYVMNLSGKPAGPTPISWCVTLYYRLSPSGSFPKGSTNVSAFLSGGPIDTPFMMNAYTLPHKRFVHVCY